MSALSTIYEEKNVNFLGEHSPVSQRILLNGSGTPQKLLAGTVLAKQTVTSTVDGIESKTVQIVPLASIGLTENTANEAWGILATDLELEADSQNLPALALVHAEVMADQLLFPTDLTEAEKNLLFEQLRKNGIYAV